MEYLNIDSKILNFINFMNDDNKQITIPEPTKFIVSTKSAKCQIMSKIDLSNVAFNISKNILENIFLGHNSNYLIMGLETDNLIIRADPKYKHPFIKCMGSTLEYFNEDYYKKVLPGYTGIPPNSQKNMNNKPYYNHANYQPPISSNDDILLQKLNYMITLLEDQQDEKTNHVTEEVVL